MLISSNFASQTRWSIFTLGLQIHQAAPAQTNPAWHSQSWATHQREPLASPQYLVRWCPSLHAVGGMCVSSDANAQPVLWSTCDQLPSLEPWITIWNPPQLCSGQSVGVVHFEVTCKIGIYTLASLVVILTLSVTSNPSTRTPSITSISCKVMPISPCGRWNVCVSGRQRSTSAVINFQVWNLE